VELLDKKFMQNKLRYVLQCLLAALSVLLILVVLDGFTKPAVVAALGASAFIAFTMPHAQVARPRFLIGGYLVGISAGTLCYWLSQVGWPGPLSAVQQYSYEACGAMAVGLAVFVMVVTNTEHPPAASLALGLSVGEWSPRTLAVVFVGILVLSILRKLLKPILISLL
jgi:CBS-domain-containing membrane protein